MNQSLHNLEQRIRALEHIEAIKRLKHRYFFNCDQKRPAEVRACFVDGPMVIDYGRIGQFEDADTMVETFEKLACAEHIVEIHHAQNPQIELLDAERARGTWGLYYFLIDTRQQICTQLAGFYEDEYRCLDGDWKISRTSFQVTSSQVLSIGDGISRILFAGRSAPAELDDPSAQAGS